MIAMNLGLCDSWSDGRLVRRSKPGLSVTAPPGEGVRGSIVYDRAEAQRVHDCDRPCPHGEDVAEDSAHAGGCALKRLDEAGVVVRFDFEGAGPALADVNDAGILARSLQDTLAARRQPFQMYARGLVGTVLAPHHAEDAEFGERGLAAAEKLPDLVEFIGREAVLAQDFRGNGHQRGCHEWNLYCRISRRGRI